MKHVRVNVTDFKARCLALLEDVGSRGDMITVTKRGRAIATVRPAEETAWDSPEGKWIGKVTVHGDLSAIDLSDLWERPDEEGSSKV